MKSRKRNYLFAVLSTAVFLIAQAVAAEDRLRLPMPPLPPMPKGSLPTITLPAPPPMVWLPTQNLHVAFESPYPIFHLGGQYYLHHGDRWYHGPSYNGPWNLNRGKIPRPIRHFRHDHWVNYQREAVQQFREDHRGQHHHFYADRPNERASWHDHERRSRRDDGYRDHDRRGRDDHHDQRGDHRNDQRGRDDRRGDQRRDRDHRNDQRDDYRDKPDKPDKHDKARN